MKLRAKRLSPDDSKGGSEASQLPSKRPRLPPPPSLSPPRAHDPAGKCVPAAGSRSFLVPPQVRRQGNANVSVEDLQQFGRRQNDASSKLNRLPCSSSTDKEKNREST